MPNPPATEPIVLDDADKQILRRLVGEYAAVAALPVHAEKAALWQRLNDLDQVRPMVWINEICFNEMNVDDELTIRCTHPWAQRMEGQLRRTLYQWRHLPADMVLSPYLACPMAIHSTGFGITEDVDVVRTDATSSVVSRHFHRQITEPEDIAKIKLPIVTHDAQATAARFDLMNDLFADIIPVKLEGRKHVWYTPWDFLIRWWGIEEAFMDMMMRPDMVNQAVSRMVDCWMHEMDQFEQQNLLALDCNNTRIGSGGFGYSSALPGEPFDPQHVRPHNMWGCSNAQILSDVSPEMHWEFALRHDLRWLERFGLTYYGCCEALHNKIELLHRVPNLRKISLSPWANIDKIMAGGGERYVLSIKPNPALLAEDTFRPEAARAELQRKLDQTRGANVEFIMKDISTVRYDPHRLWHWAAIAMEVVHEHAAAHG